MTIRDGSRPDSPSLPGSAAGQERRLWRSLEELAAAPHVAASLEAEFPDPMQAGSIDRRTWLRLMGASLGLAGFSGCIDAPRKAPLLSQARNAPGHAPGTPVFIATSLELDGVGRGVLAKTQDGRLVKIEGNPLHPASLGATDVFAQAEVLSLYDPTRSRTPLESGTARGWAAFERYLAVLRDDMVAGRGRGLRLLMPPVASPTLDRLAGALRARLPEAAWHFYAPLALDHRRAGAVQAFGRPLDFVYDLTRADAIVTLGGDLFATEPGHVRYAADYQARRREPGRPLPHLVAAESSPSLVGARADQRIALRPRDMPAFAHALAAALAGGSPPTDAHPAVARIAAGLARAGPRALIAVGREQPAAIHAAAHAMNVGLNAFGTTLRAVDPVVPAAGQGADIIALAEAIGAGDVRQLVVLGGNPAYDAPADLDLAGLIRRVPLSLHLGYHRDETAAACRWHVPQCHALEAFGDLHAFDGTLGLRQPATARLAPSLSTEEMLGLVGGKGADGRELLAATWRDAWGEAFADRFARSFEAGVVAGTAFPSVPVTLRADWNCTPAPPAPSAPFDVVFAADPSVWDGRFAQNAWLQELPRPFTKQVWGNAALVAPDTAAVLGLRNGDLVEVRAASRSLAAPVWLLPGQAPGTVTLPLGYGRVFAGASEDVVGFDAYRLRTSAEPWIVGGTVRRLAGRVALITTQQHHAVAGQDVYRVVGADEANAAGDAAAAPSLYPEWRYDGHAWGMTIDLDACIGCNACVVACQAENNVAVVGPEQVARGREMHWLRVDRSYSGDPAEPKTYFQPVPCMHCETAPCEVVCPVNATVHSAEGLNDMVYNRCIGTRTCSNNCPYKVRRFNFLDYHAGAYATPGDGLNPQVTVRDRGVMEKCTYCVQRISAARIEAGIEERAIRDGDVVTACQQACPTQAIVFGDINDSDSAVSRLKRSPRNYSMLGKLNTQPRTTYLARVELPAGKDG